MHLKPGWAAAPLAKLDTSVGVSGPHDFAVRDLHRSSACRPIAHGKPALRSPQRADAVASTASRPTSVTIASRPSCERDGRIYRGDLPVGLFASKGAFSRVRPCPLFAPGGAGLVLLYFRMKITHYAAPRNTRTTFDRT